MFKHLTPVQVTGLACLFYASLAVGEIGIFYSDLDTTWAFLAAILMVLVAVFWARYWYNLPGKRSAMLVSVVVLVSVLHYGAISHYSGKLNGQKLCKLSPFTESCIKKHPEYRSAIQNRDEALAKLKSDLASNQITPSEWLVLYRIIQENYARDYYELLISINGKAIPKHPEQTEVAPY